MNAKELALLKLWGDSVAAHLQLSEGLGAETAADTLSRHLEKAQSADATGHDIGKTISRGKRFADALINSK